ncbi:MAG TPA: hypothetical protein EYH15_01630 [Methanothermococcus okinawensis]|uniref:PRC-barrel domain-containing protein n=1 Tax=Methanothermococcus okinawensis TaxID=155863 RepID=A0A832ZJV9_9EURY|nr:hypothetical protein [Methanothermococcus okinawensis]HIP91817.1 hypothetical protein [Methanothermococcus okinawensis]
MAIKVSEILNKKIYTTQGYYVGEVYDAMIDTDKAVVSGIVVSDVYRGCLKDKVDDPSKKVVIPYRVVEAIGNIILVKLPKK